MISLRQLGPVGLRRLLEVQHAEEAQLFPGGAVARKRRFAERLLIDAERHEQLLRNYIARIYETEEAQAAIGRHLDKRNNLLRRFADTLAIAYDVPPAREVAGVSERRQRAFMRAYRDARTDQQAEIWGRYAWIANVVHVLPRYEAQGLRWVTVLPHAADVVFDPAGGDEPEILVYDSNAHGARRVAVDAERWWWLDANYKLLKQEEHGAGRRPWAVFRTAAPAPGDYWDRNRRDGLVDGTYELARVEAARGYARKVQGKNAPWINVGEDAELPPGQTLNGETPLMSRGQVTLGMLELAVDPAHYEADARNIVIDAAASEGVEVGAFTGEGSASEVHESLVKARNRQLKHLGRGEADAAVAAAATLMAAGHPGGIDPEIVADSFRVNYAELTLADHPRDRVATYKDQIALGLTDHYAVYQAENPGTTREQAREAVHEHIEHAAEFYDFVASRNSPTGEAAELQSLAQVQGAIGGRMAAKDTPDGEANDDERATAAAG